MIWSKGLVKVSDWALGAVARAGLTPEAACPVQGRGACQSERLGSWRCGLGGV